MEREPARKKLVEGRDGNNALFVSVNINVLAGNLLMKIINAFNEVRNYLFFRCAEILR